MATKTFNARFQFKGDTLANWNAANPVLLKNELVIVTVPAEAGAVAQEPAVLFKVGDGTTAFKDLKFSSGIAADVYDWAKAADKPGYSADEITGLAEFIANNTEDTDTQYKLEQDETDKHILKLSSKAKDATEWTVVATITTADTVYDDAEVTGKVTALEGLVGSEAVATQIANAIAALKLAETYATKAEVKTVSDAVAVLNGTGEGSVDKKVADAVAAIVADAPEAYDTLKEISDWISGHADSAAEMNTNIGNNKKAIEDLAALVGQLPESAASTTVVAYISEVVGVEIGKLGALASKDKVAKADLDDALKAEVEGKANDADLAAIAKSGNVNDLVQTAGDIIVFDCGSATTVI